MHGNCKDWYKEAWVPLLIFWAVLTVQIAAFFSLSGMRQIGCWVNVLIGMADAAVILLPYVFIGRRWRWSVVVPMIAVPVYLYANILYFRNFSDMMGFSTMFGFQNVTGAVADSTLSSVRIDDLWIGIPFLIFLVCYLISLRCMGKNAFDRRFKVSMVVAVIALFTTEQVVLQSKMWSFVTKGEKQFSFSEHKGILKNFFPHYNRSMTLRFYGFPVYWAFELASELKPAHKLSKDEKAEIDRIFASRPEDKVIVDSMPDNGGKNLIIIVVESLNSSGLYAEVNGKPAMRFLSGYLGREDVFVADNIMSQVGSGRSSDGRFIIHTGLLPTLNNPVAMTFPDEHYPSLSEAIGGEAMEFDCASPMQWNNVRLSKSYGFRKLFTEKEMIRGMKKLGGKDVALFNNALLEIKKMKQPFVAALNTMDMHDPYDRFGWKKSDVWQDTSYSENEKVYIDKLRQFDAGLSQFIAGLKKTGLYNNSVIVIVADHNARESALTGERLVSPAIPLIILNSGLGLKTHATLGQIDIYPTLLDVMGVEGYAWRGLGRSILRNPDVFADKLDSLPDPYSYPSRQDWELSERMITGGYFSR